MAERLHGPYNISVVGDDSKLKYTLMETLTGDKHYVTEWPPIGKKAAHSADDMFSWYPYDVRIELQHPEYGTNMTAYVWSLTEKEFDRFILGPRLYRPYRGFMLVYDVTDAFSFEKITSYAKELESLVPSVPKLLVGMIQEKTKHKRLVTTEQGRKKAIQLSMDFMEVNVEDKTAVEQACASLLADHLERKKALSYGISYQLYRNLSSTRSVNDILRHGVEENYHIRVMVIGEEGVGKSTLTSRLLQRQVNIEQYNTTDGIYVHVHSCEVDLETGEWRSLVVQREKGIIYKLKTLFGILPKDETSQRTDAEGGRDIHYRVAKLAQGHDPGRKPSLDDEEDKPVAINLPPYDQVSLGNEKHVNTNTTVEGVSKDSGNIYDTDDSDKEHPSVTFYDKDKLLQEVKVLQALGNTQKAKISFYDFAGQEIFHASHPTFLSSKAVYILVFNLKSMLECKNKETKATQEAESDKDSVRFWLNVIYMFASIKKDIQPHVLLVGTHADKLPTKDRESIKKQLFDGFRQTIEDTPFNSILRPKEFAVDNTKQDDPVYTKIKKEIFEVAQSLPNWGEKTPSTWLPLEREIQLLKDKCQKVIPLSNLKDINKKLEVGVSSDDEMRVFLQFLHDTGEIVYFCEEGLRDIVVLDPIWMIDALKTIITARQFVIRKPTPVKVEWKKVYESGIISKRALEIIFDSNKRDRSLFDNCEHVIRLMEKFLFIAAPVTIREELASTASVGEEQTDVTYIMPCMVKENADKDLISTKEGKSSTTVFCIIPDSKFLPPAVFHKILAMCITKWPVVEQKGQRQIFSGLCKFNIDKQRLYKLTVFQVGYAVHAKIDSFVDEMRPVTGICQPVMEFLTYSMTSVLQAMGFADEFKTCIQCPQYSVAEPRGYLDTELMRSQKYITCDECESSHTVETKEILGCWKDLDNEEQEERSSEHGHDRQDDLAAALLGFDPNEQAEQNEDERDIDDGPMTKENLNHARLCNALVKVCADGLREILLSQLPQGCPDFHHLLVAKEAQVRRLRQLRDEQLDILYPDPQNQITGRVDQFDITLLYTLIRNISAVVSPVTGWAKPPNDNPRDTSLGANVERIRCFRNVVVGHSVDYSVDDQTYENTWKEISLAMGDIENVIGDKGFKKALDERKKQVFTLRQARFLQAKLKGDLLEVGHDLDQACIFLDQARKKLTTIADAKV